MTPAPAKPFQFGLLAIFGLTLGVAVVCSMGVSETAFRIGMWLALLTMATLILAPAIPILKCKSKSTEPPETR
jgi:hypothetical protein